MCGDNMKKIRKISSCWFFRTSYHGDANNLKRHNARADNPHKSCSGPSGHIYTAVSWRIEAV